MDTALAMLIFMILSFFAHKFPYGVISMTCVVVLRLTGVIETGQVFSGFSYNTAVLAAAMMVATFAFAVGQHNPVRTLKFTIPYLLVGIVTLIFNANLFSPFTDSTYGKRKENII